MIISAVLVTASGVTLLVIYLPPRIPEIPGFEWQFPSNSTLHDDYVKVPYMIPMRDGVRLATDIFVPRTITGPLPVIFSRTPYDKDMLDLLSGFTLEGYIVVLQDIRGFFASEGEITLPFFTEYKDGHDSLEWITAQPWCNGKIGTWGPSALGIAQLLMAPNAPDSLKCILPIVATPDMYNGMFRGGQFRHELVIPWLEANSFPKTSLDLILEHEKLDDIWQTARIVDNYSDIHTASLHLGGWYDIFTQGTIDSFMGFNYEGGIGAKGNAKLVMGPWTHGGSLLGGPSGEINYPNQNSAIMLNTVRALFEKWLKGNYTLWDLYPTAAFYLMSSVEHNPGLLANRWYQSDKWPLNHNVQEFYLDYYYGGGGILNDSSVVDHNTVSYLWDGLNYVDTIGGGNLNTPAGTYDQRPVEGREGVLLFSTDVLSEIITVVGQINVTLYIESNCTDTDFTVKLTDVYPDGRSMLISDTIIRARNRLRVTDWDFLTPGVIYEINIPMENTAYLFNEGHLLQIAISSSNYPRFEVNPNTGDPLWQNDSVYVANNTIHFSSTFPSKISLPVVEYNNLVPFSFNVLPKTHRINEVSEKETPLVLKSTTWIPLAIILLIFRKRRINL
jgi:predicted acyl esterase